jgi:hypothetical protein
MKPFTVCNLNHVGGNSLHYIEMKAYNLESHSGSDLLNNRQPS